VWPIWYFAVVDIVLYGLWPIWSHPCGGHPRGLFQVDGTPLSGAHDNQCPSRGPLWFMDNSDLVIIIIIIIKVKIIVTLSQKNAAGALYKTLYQNLQLTLCNK